jgi:HAD superfamily hydrolase (TIGR01450 family)
VTEPLVGGSERPLAQRHDVGLYDLDGVLYVGQGEVPGAASAVVAAAAAGLRPAYVTNNAARTPRTVADHLAGLGFPADPDDVVTSAQAAATLLVELVPAGSPVLVVGGDGLVEALRERGLEPVDEAAGAVAVVQGFAPDLGWRLLAEGTYAVAAGLPWVAANLDATVPTEKGRAPGNGLLVGLVAQAAGRGPDVVAGKPEPALHRESVRRTGAVDPIVVGDRLDTDVEGANRVGVPSLLVLTGVTTPVELLTAALPLRPTYLAADLEDGLMREHPALTRAAGEAVCAGWRVRVDGGEVTVEGRGERRVDGLRALCVAWWDAAAPAEKAARAVAAVGW